MALTDFVKRYYMKTALKISESSKDPNTKVGAIIVRNNKIIGSGINEMPKKLNSEFPWERNGDFVNTKYAYVEHAEINAILDAMDKGCTDLSNSEIYVTLFPCNECAKVIVQLGIKNIYYYSDKYHDEPSTIASRKIFEVCGVTTENISSLGDVKIG